MDSLNKLDLERMKDSLRVLMVTRYYSNTAAPSYRKDSTLLGAGLGLCKAGCTAQVLKIYLQQHLSWGWEKTLLRNMAHCHLNHRQAQHRAAQPAGRAVHSPGPGDATKPSVMSGCSLLLSKMSKAWRRQQEHAQLQQDRAQHGLQNPAGRWGPRCSKISLPSHTTFSKSKPCQACRAMRGGEFGRTRPPRSLVVKNTPSSLTGITATAKAVPSAPDPSTKVRFYTSFSTVTARVGQSHQKFTETHLVYC